jgi:ADP-ribose pyrophosphatase YjhB (NUDIX family)
MQRCLVKAIALHGLGLYIYAGEDLPEGEPEPKIGEETRAKLTELATTKEIVNCLKKKILVFIPLIDRQIDKSLQPNKVKVNLMNGSLHKPVQKQIQDFKKEVWSNGGVCWERAYLHDGLIVYAMDDENYFYLIMEKRPHETPSHRLKMVTGIYEPEFGLEENVNRELQEEIGKKAREIELLFSVHSTGTINTTTHIVWAKGLSDSKLPNPDGEDTIMEIRKVSYHQLEKMVMNNELRWSLSTLGFFKIKQLKEERQLLTTSS